MDNTVGNEIKVGKLRLDYKQGLYTVSAPVDGRTLWFQSSNHRLRPAPEGFAGALLVAALHLRRNLVFEDSLCPVWLKNAQNLMAIYQSWWGWPPIKICSLRNGPPFQYEGNFTALCFSGGVDSFHSISTYPKPVHHVVTVHGLDIALDDDGGAAVVFGNAQYVAAKYNVNAVSIKTNLRQHHIARKRYRESFEGALAALGYLIDGVATQVISSDYSRTALLNFHHGSHWMTAPLRSSADIKIVHYGDQYSRDEKLRQIADNPLLSKHLRVCQKNLTNEFDLALGHLNCGTCDKCLRTLIPIMQTVGDIPLVCFKNTINLDKHINKIVAVDNYSCSTYEKFCNIGVESSMEKAIRALIWRSNFLHNRPWLGRKGRKLVGSFLKLLSTLKY